MTSAEWHGLGSIDELARTPLRQLVIGRTRIALSCVGGEFAAVSGACNHAGGPLGDGQLGPAPWEWDLKRLAASFVVASRDNGLIDAAARETAATCVRTYREAMAAFSQMKTLELWYYAIDGDELVADIKDAGWHQLRRPDHRQRRRQGDGRDRCGAEPRQVGAVNLPACEARHRCSGVALPVPGRRWNAGA